MVKSHQNAAPLPNKCQSRPPMGGSCHLQNMKTDFLQSKKKLDILVSFAVELISACHWCKVETLW